MNVKTCGWIEGIRISPLLFYKHVGMKTTGKFVGTIVIQATTCPDNALMSPCSKQTYWCLYCYQKQHMT